METRAVTALLALIVALAGHAGASKCPFFGAQGRKAAAADQPRLLQDASLGGKPRALLQAQPDYNLVKEDLQALFLQNQAFWPYDFGTYAPFFVRLAWHCSGSYRHTDGRGGCDGARIRFSPERQWPDNQNLDKALTILQPLYDKWHPSGLSWGDLIILGGNAALESMGSQTLGFCGGRQDDTDGSASDPLGPTAEQEIIAPCLDPYNCTAPLGTTVIGLIYPDPEGPHGVPDPLASAAQMRDVFGRMGFNDTETVALIGGGHSVGKMHGACPLGPGLCGTPGTADYGIGLNTYTSGFEGVWSFHPTNWGPEMLMHLLGHYWESYVGPGGRYQWKPVTPSMAPGTAGMPTANPLYNITEHFMLTTDIALVRDPAYLNETMALFYNSSYFNASFAAAWYKLTSHDMGPATRCLGNLTLPPQPFQHTLPPTPSSPPQADYWDVRGEIIAALKNQSAALYPADLSNNGRDVYYGALFAQLAWRCAATFRSTDYQGGCNGARIRLAPQKDWPININLNKVLDVLEPIKQLFDGRNLTLSWADLIVAAGNVAIEKAAGITLNFCGGRVDSETDGGGDYLAPRTYGDAVTEVTDNAAVMGLTTRQAVALSALIKSPTRMGWLGYGAQTWSSDGPTKMSNAYFSDLQSDQWLPVTIGTSPLFYRRPQDANKDSALSMLPEDVALINDPTMSAIVNEYAANNTVFLEDFGKAWTQLMIADRFDGPTGNLCN